MLSSSIRMLSDYNYNIAYRLAYYMNTNLIAVIFYQFNLICLDACE